MSLQYPDRTFIVSEGDAFVDQYGCLLCSQCATEVQERRERRESLSHDARWPERRAADDEIVRLQQECDWCGKHIPSFNEKFVEHWNKHYEPRIPL